jgi:hypothetical protein
MLNRSLWSRLLTALDRTADAIGSVHQVVLMLEVIVVADAIQEFVALVGAPPVVARTHVFPAHDRL